LKNWRNEYSEQGAGHRIAQKTVETDGWPDGIRDERLLDSALSNQFQTFNGLELYPSASAKTARIA
jgi:hypothetical protein